ncbi:hypothetical protein NRIC_16850 [Enterococcus florum]|uniref:NodB homology domain-containing protein n=1 Tax=Enterococcus florum TaxID=2480627 RepID=A0A4P5PBF0_9ENTE|nr:polysaccharide deacetylase family protein [Enterococcus florum]GCF93794.1 hypothetical protein NRIC_16850 [Enterococcus florum]
MNRAQRYHQKKKKTPIVLFFLFLSLILLTAGGFFLYQQTRLQLIGKEHLEIPENGVYSDPGVKLSEKQKALSRKHYKTHGEVDPTKAGTYNIDYVYSSFGLKSKISRKVTVKPMKHLTPPAITLEGDSTLYVPSGKEFQDPGASAFDHKKKCLTKKIKRDGNVDTYTPGKYNVSYKVTDARGLSSEVTREVVVTKGVIYLTFDDGPHEKVTPQFLDILKEEKIKGTFFVTGMGPDKLLKRIHDEGHAIGLHTNTHEYSSVYSSTKAYFADLEQVNQRVKRVTGVESKITRFPGGSTNTICNNYSPGIMATLIKEVPQRGYTYYDWNVSSGDGSHQTSADQPYHNVTSTLKPDQNNVVLMHDTKQTSADALRRIIQYGKQHGYSFEPLTPECTPVQF